MVLRRFCTEVVQNRFGHAGVELVGTESVAAADDSRVGFQLAVAGFHHFADCGAYVFVHRFAQRTGFFGAVEYCDGFDGFRQCSNEVLGTEWPVQMHFQYTDFLAFIYQVFNGLFHGLGTAAHQDNNPFCIRGTNIVEQVVLTTGQFGELVHSLLNDFRSGVVVFIYCFTSGEKDVRVLTGSTNNRFFRVHRPSTVSLNQFRIDHLFHYVVRNLFHFLDFMA